VCVQSSKDFMHVLALDCQYQHTIRTYIHACMRIPRSTHLQERHDGAPELAAAQHMHLAVRSQSLGGCLAEAQGASHTGTLSRAELRASHRPPGAGPAAVRAAADDSSPPAGERCCHCTCTKGLNKTRREGWGTKTRGHVEKGHCYKWVVVSEAGGRTITSKC
jgi:hypothetical protein